MHERFDRLRRIVHLWERRLAEMPETVQELFDTGDLAGIRALLQERRQLAEQIRLFKQFIEKWEKPGLETILGVPKAEHDKTREVFQRSEGFRD